MFNSFNSASGKDLNWFFNNWFFGYGYIDLAIANVSGNAVTVKNIGGFYAPFDLVVGYDDGATETLHQTPAVWQANGSQTVVNIKTQKKVRSLTISGGIFMDADETNNKWQAP